MDKVVISIGGSILVPDDEDTKYIEDLAAMLKELAAKYKLYVVVGGGRIARYYIKIGRVLKADESYLDDMGIEVTRLNARLLIAALGDKAYHIPAKNFDEALNASKSHDIVVMGGTHPGHTTDAVSVMLGERVRADRLINATSVDGVYTADPKKDPDAKKIDKLTFKELLDIVMKVEGGAGPNVVFDHLGTQILARAKIPTCIVHGRDLEALRNAVEGKEFKGTIVKE